MSFSNSVDILIVQMKTCAEQILKMSSRFLRKSFETMNEVAH